MADASSLFGREAVNKSFPEIGAVCARRIKYCFDDCGDVYDYMLIFRTRFQDLTQAHSASLVAVNGAVRPGVTVIPRNHKKRR